jgi:hypothetical protein
MAGLRGGADNDLSGTQGTADGWGLEWKNLTNIRRLSPLLRARSDESNDAPPRPTQLRRFGMLGPDRLEFAVL